MEVENESMDIFGSGMELNVDSNMYDYENDSEELEDNETEVNNEQENNNPVEENVPESVDGDEDENNEENESDVDSSPNLYSSISNVLFEQGIIPSLESSENIKTSDDFVGALKREIDIQAEQRLEEYLQNLDLNKIAISRKTQIELSNIDEDYLKDNLDVAKDIIFRDYINQGLSEDRASKLLRKTRLFKRYGY